MFSTAPTGLPRGVAAVFLSSFSRCFWSLPGAVRHEQTIGCAMSRLAHRTWEGGLADESCALRTCTRPDSSSVLGYVPATSTWWCWPRLSRRNRGRLVVSAPRSRSNLPAFRHSVWPCRASPRLASPPPFASPSLGPYLNSSCLLPSSPFFLPLAYSLLPLTPPHNLT